MYRYGWACALFSVLALFLVGCDGGDGAGSTGTTNTQNLTRAAGGTVTAGNVSVAFPALALSQDAAVTVTESPDLPGGVETNGLVSSVQVLSTAGVTLSQLAPATITLPATRANTFPIYAYRVAEDGTLTEVDATRSQNGNTATVNITSFGTFALYNAQLGTLPQAPQAVVTSIAPLTGTALYGNVRLRVKNLLDPNATVSVKVGNLTSPQASIAFVDANAPDSSANGGAVDFRVPVPLAAGQQDIVVTVGSATLAPFTVNVTNTNPHAVFTLNNNDTFVAELRRDVAAYTVDNFVGLAMGTKTWTPTYQGTPLGAAMNTPLYDGVTFHRVTNLDPNAPNTKIVQGGDPTTKLTNKPAGYQPGFGGPGFTINFEQTGLTHVDGALAMARGNSPHSAGSQFFIDDGAQSFLNPSPTTQGYVVFGRVIEGMDKVRAITQGTVLKSVVITGKLQAP